MIDEISTVLIVEKEMKNDEKTKGKFEIKLKTGKWLWGRTRIWKKEAETE